MLLADVEVQADDVGNAKIGGELSARLGEVGVRYKGCLRKVAQLPSSFDALV